MNHFFGSGSGSGSGWESGSGWNDILFWLYQQEMNSGSGGSGYDWLWDVLAEEASGSGSGEVCVYYFLIPRARLAMAVRFF